MTPIKDIGLEMWMGSVRYIATTPDERRELVRRVWEAANQRDYRGDNLQTVEGYIKEQGL